LNTLLDRMKAIHDAKGRGESNSRILGE
jgi:hypothetical protein